MSFGKSFRVLEKNKAEQTHSIILEHRSKPETLLFESQAVANLCKSKKEKFSYSNYRFFLPLP